MHTTDSVLASLDSDNTPRSRPRQCVIELAGVSRDLSESAGPASREFAFRANDYYLSLIDWSDPSDPIRRLIVPSEGETADFGVLDASNEVANTKLPGLQHKYADTVLLLATDQCAGFCRYCFRKRLFMTDARETIRDHRPWLEYLSAHPEVSDVLLTGGDPLTLPAARLREVVEGVLTIDHIKTVRIGSKIPAFNPSRIIEDSKITDIISLVVNSGRSVYVMTHFDHAREITPQAKAAVSALRDAGAECLNQCPVTTGINDDPGALAELLQTCTDAGCPQYYVFQCRPTVGNAPFAMPIVRAFEVFEQARSQVSGLSRRARFCLSHESGKVEIVGVDERHLYARYHRAKDPENAGRFLTYQRDDAAKWLDEMRLAEQPALT